MKVLSAAKRGKHKETKEILDYIISNLKYCDGDIFLKEKQIGCVNKHNGYKWVRILNKTYSFSRVVFAICNKRWPENVVDHINGNRLDNRIENLRDVDERVNTLNTVKVRQRGHFPGVCYRVDTTRAKPWRAFAPAKFLNRDKSKKKFIKSFKTKEEAIIAVINFCTFGEAYGVSDL